jgi:hypothetical protein
MLTYALLKPFNGMKFDTVAQHKFSCSATQHGDEGGIMGFYALLAGICAPCLDTTKRGEPARHQPTPYTGGTQVLARDFMVAVLQSKSARSTSK